MDIFTHGIVDDRGRLAAGVHVDQGDQEQHEASLIGRAHDPPT
jgi:hypothetical protein